MRCSCYNRSTSMILSCVLLITTIAAIFSITTISATQTIETSLLTCVEAPPSRLPFCGFIQQVTQASTTSFFLVLDFANETSMTDSVEKRKTTLPNRHPLPSSCSRMQTGNTLIPPLLRSTGMDETSWKNNDNGILVATTLFCQIHTPEHQASAFMYIFNSKTKTIALSANVYSTITNPLLNPLENPATSLISTPIFTKSKGGIILFNKVSLQGAYFFYQASVTTSHTLNWKRVSTLITAADGTPTFSGIVPTSTSSSALLPVPIIIRIKNRDLCMMDQIEFKLKCQPLFSEFQNPSSTISTTNSSNIMSWSHYTNMIQIPASSSSTLCSSQTSSTTPFGFCGTNLLTFDSSLAVNSTPNNCQALPFSASKVSFTSFDVSKYGSFSSVVSTTPSIESPKRIFQLRRQGASSSNTFTLLSFESLSFLGTFPAAASEGQNEIVNRFNSSCAENPPQVTWSKTFSPPSSSSSSSTCTPDLLLETPFQLIVRNVDCTLSCLDVENGQVLWTTTQGQKMAATPDPFCVAHRSSFSEVILLDFASKVAFVEAQQGNILVLNMSNGGLVQSIPDTPAIAHCLSNAVNTGNPMTTANSIIHIVAITRDQGETRVIPVTIIGATYNSVLMRFLSNIMSSLIRFSFRPSTSWRKWNSFETWSGISVVPGTLSDPNRAPLWNMVSYNFDVSSPLFDLVFIDESWFSSPLVLELGNINAVAAPIIPLSALPQTHTKLQNINSLKTTMQLTICAPSPSYSFSVTGSPSIQVQLIAVSGQTSFCVNPDNSNNNLVYSTFELVDSPLLSSSSTTSWQTLFMSVNFLRLTNAQLSGSLQKDTKTTTTNRFSITQTPLTSLDLSRNPLITGYMIEKIWPHLTLLNLAGTAIATDPSALPNAFSTHLISCDSHYRYALQTLDVSGCSKLRGVFAVSGGSLTCLPVNLNRINITGISIVDAIDLRITSNSTSSHFEKQHSTVDIYVNPEFDLRQHKISVICGRNEEQVPSILIDSRQEGGANNAWDPCNTTKTTPTATSRVPEFSNINVVDATNENLWLPMHPFCINMTVGYPTGNYLPFSSGSETRILNNTAIIFQIYPSLVHSDDQTISFEGSPARISDATVQARVNSFDSFQQSFSRVDIRCGIVPLHWWLAAKAPLNQNKNLTDDTTQPQLVDMVFGEAIKANLTSCMKEILTFQFYQPPPPSTPVSTTTITTTTTTVAETTTTATTTPSNETLTSASDTTQLSSTTVPTSTTVITSSPNSGGESGGQGNSEIDLHFEITKFTFQLMYLPLNITSVSTDSSYRENNNNNNFDARIIINTTAAVTEKNLKTNVAKSFDSSFSWQLDDDGDSCPSAPLLDLQGYCLVETPPTYHRVDFYPDWINMSKIDTSTNPSQVDCTVPKMQVAVLADGRVFPWVAFQGAQALCAPKQFALSGLIQNCSMYPVAEEEDTLYCVGFATGGSARRSTYSTSFCAVNWVDVPLCEASREVDSVLLGGDVSLKENFFQTIISGPPSSTVFSACTVDSHSSQGVAVAGFVRIDQCQPLSVLFPPPYKQLDENIQRSDLQELLQACTDANQCSFYDETTGKLVCDLVSAKLRLLALCFAVRGYNVSVTESVLRKITTVIAQDCSLTAADDPNNPYDASKFYRETVDLFSLSVENILIRSEYDETHDMTHFIWCNPPSNKNLSATSSTTTTVAPPGALTTTTTTKMFPFSPSSSTTSPSATTVSPSSNNNDDDNFQPVVWSFSNGQCVSGVRITTSMCRPYIEPHVFPLSYTTFVLAALKDIIVMIIVVGLFSLGFVRRAFGRFFARFLFNLAPFYQDEKDEWMEKFAKRVAPRTITIDEVADNFRDLLADPESMGFDSTSFAVPSLSSLEAHSRPNYSSSLNRFSNSLANNNSSAMGNDSITSKDARSLLFLKQKSSLFLIDRHGSEQKQQQRNKPMAAAAAAQSSSTTLSGNINNNENKNNNNPAVAAPPPSVMNLRKSKLSILSEESDSDDDMSDVSGSKSAFNLNSSGSSSPNHLQNSSNQKWIGGLPQTNKLWIEFGTVNRAMSTLAGRIQKLFHSKRRFASSNLSDPYLNRHHQQVNDDSSSLNEDASAVLNYDPNRHKTNTVSSFDVVSSLHGGGKSTNVLDRDATLEDDEQRLLPPSSNHLGRKNNNHNNVSKNSLVNDNDSGKFSPKEGETSNSNDNNKPSENDEGRSYSPPLTELMDESSSVANPKDGHQGAEDTENLLPKGSSGEKKNDDDSNNNTINNNDASQDLRPSSSTSIPAWSTHLNQRVDNNNNNNNNNKSSSNERDENQNDNDGSENSDDLDIVYRDDFHLFERIILLRGKQLVKNVSKADVRQRFTALLFIWSKYDSHKLRFGLRKMNKKERKALQNFLDVAEFEDTVLELDQLKWRFTPQIWFMAFEFLFCLAYFIICIVQVQSDRKGDTAWNKYQSTMFRFMNACTPVSLLTNSMLRRFYKEDLRPDFFFFASLALMLPAILTHVIPAIFIYIWVVALTLCCLMLTLFIGEFFRKHGREVLHGLVAKSAATSVFASASPASSPTKKKSTGDSSSAASTNYEKYDDDNLVVGSPSSPLQSHDVKVDDSVTSRIAEQNTKSATVVSVVIYIVFRILVTLCVAVLFQTLFNYAVLFYDRERLGLSYGGVVTYEWNSRTITCPTWATGFGIANTLQLLSFLF